MVHPGLNAAPPDEVRDCISPVYAERYKILPVRLSDSKEILYIASVKGVGTDRTREFGRDIRKAVRVEPPLISREEFYKAYHLFYDELLSQIKS